MSTVKKVILSVLLVLILAIVSFIIYEVATVNNTYYIGEKIYKYQYLYIMI